MVCWTRTHFGCFSRHSDCFFVEFNPHFADKKQPHFGCWNTDGHIKVWGSQSSSLHSWILGWNTWETMPHMLVKPCPIWLKLCNYSIMVEIIEMIYYYISDWWFGTWIVFSIYWEESSQLTFIFFRGVETTNQIFSSQTMPHMLHGAGIVTNICPKNMPSFVGKYASTMEHLGANSSFEVIHLQDGAPQWCLLVYNPH